MDTANKLSHQLNSAGEKKEKQNLMKIAYFARVLFLGWKGCHLMPRHFYEFKWRTYLIRLNAIMSVVVWPHNIPNLMMPLSGNR